MVNPLISKHHDRYSSDITIDDFPQWGLPHDVIEIFTKPGFFLHLPPIPGAIDGVAKLVEWGYDIIIATNHSDTDYIAADKVLWVQRNLPILADNMMIGSRKDVLQGDVIIDDNPDYLLNSPCPIKICMDRPWNRELDEWQHFNFYRVYNWRDILNLFEGGAFKVW